MIEDFLGEPTFTQALTVSETCTKIHFDFKDPVATSKTITDNLLFSP